MSTSAQATGFNYQQALYNHNIRMLTDPNYARTYYALGLGLGIPQAQSTQNSQVQSQGNGSVQIPTGIPNLPNVPTVIPNPNTGN